MQCAANAISTPPASRRVLGAAAARPLALREALRRGGAARAAHKDKQETVTGVVFKPFEEVRPWAGLLACCRGVRGHMHLGASPPAPRLLPNH